MIINGKTTTLDDGSTVCIGFGKDSDGNVTGRFAVPEGHDWDCPNATDSIETVESLDGLPAVNNLYLQE